MGAVGEAPPRPAHGGIRVREALRTRAFWALFLAYMCTPLAVFTVITHQVAFAVDHGFPRLFVASIFGLTGFVSLSGQFADGGFQNPPNTIGYPGYSLVDGRVGVFGDHWRLSVFGRNLGDEVYVLNNVSGNNYWSQPRVVGVELTLRR